MNLEEFIAAGCLQCGMHEFKPTGPISPTYGASEITCVLCETPYNRADIGELDSLTWERQRSTFSGNPFIEQRITRYQNEEQFIDAFEKAVEGNSND